AGGAGCRECNPGYYLSSGDCVSSCPGVIIPSPDTCATSCPSDMIEADNKVCMMKCTTPGKFLIPDQGCVGNCLPNCNVCSNTTYCFTCSTIRFADGTCRAVVLDADSGANAATTQKVYLTANTPVIQYGLMITDSASFT